MENPKVPERIGSGQNKTIVLLLVIIIAGVLLLTAGLLLTSPAHRAGNITAVVSIEASPRNYSLWMSSVPGMGLTPNVTGTASQNLTYRWNTSYGIFASWSALTGYRVLDRGSGVTNNGETVYWNFYNGTSGSIPNDPVVIRLSVTDKNTGARVGASEIRVDIIDNVTAVVME
ncbi:MAG: hypothetical protein ABFC24_11525 [Methanoregulaceae archaeon]